MKLEPPPVIGEIQAKPAEIEELEGEDDNIDIEALIRLKSQEYEVNPELALEIVRRESNFKPEVCNQKYGCTAGQGLMQVIPSTNKYCEEKLGKKLDPFNPKDNLDCGLWLLKNEGIRHWQGYSGDYSSYF